MTLKNITFLAAFVLLATGCGSLQRQSDINASDELSDTPVAHLDTGELPSSKVSSNISQPYKSPLGEIALDRNKHTEMWLKYFQGRGRKHMVKYLERSSRYLPMMKNVLRENGLPEDLVYIALIESGFSPVAHSRANAVGYWQFIRDTGRRYGLRLDNYIDERRDPVQSTRAAAQYFKTLYDMLGSWHLAMAAYNTGENRVRRLVAKYNTRDFWTLIQKRGLYRETKHYVPKYIAATIIAKDPAAYGFTELEYQAPLAYDTILVPHPISLKALTDGMGADIETMKMLNPKFRGDYVPLYENKPVVLRVPMGTTRVAISMVAQAEVKTPPIVKADYVFYRVRRGDTLGHIAARHRTSVGTIRRLNNMGSRSFLRVGQSLKVPERGYSQHYPSAVQQAESNSTAESSSSVEDQTAEASYHVVRRGENLTLIAKKYSVSVDTLRRLNSLSNRSVLKVGQRLLIRAGEESQTVDSGSRSTHTVSQGEHLTAIAKRYNTSVERLRTMNKLKSNRLLVGQRLQVPGRAVAAVAPAPVAPKVVNKPFFHVVHSGENLSTIATKYNTTVGQLKEMNRIRPNSVLYVGQKVKISERSLRHTVRRGETLSAIAQKYNVSVREIVRANEMKSKKVVLAGQSLIIPE